MVQVYIGLGSNLDKPEQQIRQALQDLGSIEKTLVVKDAGLFKSAPMGPKDQPDYLNSVALIETELDEELLLDKLQEIENLHGRVRARHWGERTLDLDILLYGDKIIKTDRLIVPHPGLPDREFVLYPLEKINPKLIIPGLGKLTALVEVCPANGIEYLGKCDQVNE